MIPMKFNLKKKIPYLSTLSFFLYKGQQKLILSFIISKTSRTGKTSTANSIMEKWTFFPEDTFTCFIQSEGSF